MKSKSAEEILVDIAFNLIEIKNELSTIYAYGLRSKDTKRALSKRLKEQIEAVDQVRLQLQPE